MFVLMVVFILYTRYIELAGSNTANLILTKFSQAQTRHQTHIIRAGPRTASALTNEILAICKYSII